MKDVLAILKDLRRPRLLIRAARIAAQDYQRPTSLPRLVGQMPTLRPGAAVMRLMELEGELDELRRRSDASYSISRHVEVLSAMMGEARLLQDTLSTGA